MQEIQKKTKPTLLYNPDLKDFSFKLADDNNVQHEYILVAQEITTLPYYIAEKGANDLSEMLVWKRGIKTNYKLEKENILKEIYVNL